MHDHECHESTRAKGKLLRRGPVPAPGLPEGLRITAYLPPGYETSNQDYALAIFFDGQNIFDDEGSYRGGWQLHRLLDYRACRGERVPLAVGIHTDWSRSAVLSPWSHDGTPALGDRMLDWITGWLTPTIRSEMRVRPGPEGVLLGGSSLGGLLSLYGFFRHPEHFGRVIAMSPSLGVAGGRHGPIYGYVHEMPRRGGRIYMDAGGRECQCTNIMNLTGDMARLLSDKGYRLGDDLLFHADPDGAHDEQAWKRRLPGALEFMCQ
jgi:predicted alpha/beta superfamily hydrolase